MMPPTARDAVSPELVALETAPLLAMRRCEGPTAKIHAQLVHRRSPLEWGQMEPCRNERRKPLSHRRRPRDCAHPAIESPLNEVSLDGARGVLFNVTGGYDMSMSEIQEAAETITSAVAPDANIIFGATLRPELEDEIIITVIGTGFDSTFSNAMASVDVESEMKNSINIIFSNYFYYVLFLSNVCLF